MRSTRLHLIMPCARPWNIVKLAPAYLQNMESHPFEVRWYLFQQGPDPDPKGIYKVNEALDMIPETDGWVITLADDTAQDPMLFRRLAEVIDQNPNAGAILFSQKRGGRHVMVPTPETMKPCHVCGGQVVWKREFIAKDRFDWDHHGGCCDGEFIKMKFNQAPERFVFIHEPLMNFGSLEW